MALLSQVSAVTAMNLRSLPQRFWPSLATVIAVALVTGVLLGFLALSNGFRQTLSGTGADDVAVFQRKGGGGELSSILTREQQQLIAEAPGIAKGADGKPLVSPELYVIVNGKRKSNGIKVNLPLRGVGPEALAVRSSFKVTQGRMFTPGVAEIVVGAQVSKQFEGFDLGQTVRLGGQDWTIVGVFEAGGSALESELWSDIALLRSVYNRGSTAQTVRAKLASPGALDEIKTYVENEPRLKLEVKTEKQFYAGQASGMSDLVLYLGWPLAIAMSFGALAGALNTMYASVDARMRDIATLRAIGFGGFPAFVGTMTEALLLSALGGVLGAVAVYFLFDGLSASTMGGGFSQVVFSLKMSPALVMQGIILALIIGFVGGFFPALRAAGAVNQPSFGWLWLSLSGRATRSDFWLRYVAIALPALIVGSVLDFALKTTVFGPLVMIVLLWPSIALQVKRLQDRGMTGWHVAALALSYAVAGIAVSALTVSGPPGLGVTLAIFAVPLAYSVFLFVQIAILQGMSGENRYGPDPIASPFGATKPINVFG